MTELPKGFLWGNSVSSMQTEGAWNEDGKGPSVYDIRPSSEHQSDWKVATDSYHRYREYFDYMKDLGMTCYRFQISWSRVCPDGDGDFNEAGIAFYDRFIDDLLARGIQPMVCLYHFDMPLHLAQAYHGFADRHVMDAFVRFGKEMMDRFAGKVKYWLTFNEQNLYHMGAFGAAGDLDGDYNVHQLYFIEHHIMMAHARLANYLHATYKQAQIGGMLAYMLYYPATAKPHDAFVARKQDEFLNQNLLQLFSTGTYSNEVLAEMRQFGIDDVFQPGDLEELSHLRSDYIAFSYYYSNVLNGDKITPDMPVYQYHDVGTEANPYLKATAEWHWQIDPLGFRYCIDQIYSKTHLPVFPIENGIGVIEEWDGQHPIQDDYRVVYHRAHIQAMKDAMQYEGIPIIGYLGWGLIDILSSQGDMRKRYGLVYVNRTNHDLRDLSRSPKKSYAWFKRVIATNGADLSDLTAAEAAVGGADLSDLTATEAAVGGAAQPGENAEPADGTARHD
ncbi:glycoside hydrolase family 1 protein [Lacticaseibacillus suihuaensis]